MSRATDVFQALQGDDPVAVAGYRLAARLGAGGMGRVYLSHTPGGRPVAIKVVRPELADDPAFRRRFGREIRAARRVRGAYTAELIDADADGTPPWLATLYVPGPSLAEAVARRGPLPVPAVLWLVAGVAEALQAIHGEAIVHRDLKPSNVLLAADGPRVIDFGISLGADLSSHTATGSAVGTPQFMAPEQASGHEVTTATDVFALGQTAAFAALGEPLYGDGPSVTVLYRIVHEKPDLERLPERLRPLMARCLAADPEQRATLAEVLDWCRRELGGEAAAGGGPAVWREVTGPEVTVPAPAPSSTPEAEVPALGADGAAPRSPEVRGRAAGAAVPASGDGTDARPTSDVTIPRPRSEATVPVTVRSPVRAQSGPLLPQPQPQATAPAEPRSRRRRTALVVAAAVTVGVLLVTGLTWTVWRGTDLFRDRDTASASAPDSTASARGSSKSSSESSSKSRSTSGAGSGAPEVSDPSAAPSKAPQPQAFPQRWLDEERALSIEDPDREGGDGDIRFVCEDVGCALESDTTDIRLLYSEPGATLDTCRTAFAGTESHDLPLPAVAAGSEICVKNPAGDIGLLVVQVKSTALWDSPGISFLLADLTLWRV
ncbi:protein kinase domain-containing protein [Streptomyces sp. NPDC002643]